MARPTDRRHLLKASLVAAFAVVASSAAAVVGTRRVGQAEPGRDDGSQLSELLVGVTSGTLQLDPRTYHLAAPVAIPAGVRLQGAGSATVLATATGERAGSLVLGAGSAVSDLRIEGGGDSRGTESDAITAPPGTVDPTVERVSVVAWHGNAVHFDAATRAVVRDLEVDGITCDAGAGNGCAVLLTSSTGDTVSPLISGVTARRCSGSAIQLEGDYDRADWRTAGFKVRSARVERCTTSDSAWAGVFLNSAFDSQVVGCTGDRNGDYGVGLEFCRSSTISDCTTEGNGTFGQALFETNSDCQIIGGTSTGNAEHGYALIQGDAVDAPPADGCAILDVASDGNGGSGIAVLRAVSSRVTGSASDNDESGVVVYGCSGCSVSVVARANRGDGVRLQSVDQVVVDGGESSVNGGAGVAVEVQDGPSGRVTVRGTSISENDSHGVDLRPGAVGPLEVRESSVEHNGGWGCTFSAGAEHVVADNVMADNARGGVQMLALSSGSISGNRLQATLASPRTTAIEIVRDGSSDGRTTVELNTASGHAVGLRASAATGTTAPLSAARNDFAGCVVPFDVDST